MVQGGPLNPNRDLLTIFVVCGWPYSHGQLYGKDLEEGLEWEKVDHSIFCLINRFPHGL